MNHHLMVLAFPFVMGNITPIYGTNRSDGSLMLLDPWMSLLNSAIKEQWFRFTCNYFSPNKQVWVKIQNVTVSK